MFNIDSEDFVLRKRHSETEQKPYVHIQGFCRTYSLRLRYLKFMVWGEEEGLDRVVQLYDGLKLKNKEADTKEADKAGNHGEADSP